MTIKGQVFKEGDWNSPDGHAGRRPRGVRRPHAYAPMAHMAIRDRIGRLGRSTIVGIIATILDFAILELCGRGLGWTPIIGAVLLPLIGMFGQVPSGFQIDFYSLLFFRVLIVVVLFVFATLVEICFSAGVGAMRSLPQRLVPEEAYAKASALDSIYYGIGGVAGPAGVAKPTGG